MILSYMKRALGQEAVDRVLEMAGRRRSDAELYRPGAWTSGQETLALAEAASALSGDPEIGRRVGEELIRKAYERGHVDFIRAAGSVGKALELTTNGGTKMSTGRVMELVDCQENSAVIAATYHDRGDAHPFWCGISSGYYGLVPGIFGAVGVITEPECTTRGFERCIYRVTWTDPRGPDQNRLQTSEIESSRERSSIFIDRFEQLHTLATEFAQAEDVETILERITERAGVAIDAPRFLFAIQTHDEERVRVHCRGFSVDAADRFAERLLAGDVVEDDRCVVAEISSGGRSYGRLGALYPRRYLLSEWDRRLVVGYARHAAAALDAVAALESARRDRDTAQGLLTLANALAEVGTRNDVARRLAGTVPLVTGCDRAAVWLWDPQAAELVREAEFPSTEDTSEGHEGEAAIGCVPLEADRRDAFHAAEWPALAGYASEPIAFTLSAQDDASDAAAPLRALMEAEGLSRCAIAPIRARGTFLGAVVAGFGSCGPEPHDVRPSGGPEDLLGRLTGLADQAAAALDNSDLLAKIQDQAAHDALTGLPNRVLVEDRARQALALRSRTNGSSAVIFVDLDRFKNINDTLGHEVGDELIKQAATRLKGCLRSSDTLARLGGDEFVVLLPEVAHPDDAVVVAEKIISTLKMPFVLGPDPVFISCSIGVALAPDHGVDYPTLLRHADSAMYQAKEAGRGTYALYVAQVGSTRHDRLELESQLHTAVARGEMRVMYQPQVDVENGKMLGVEALVRWQHPTLGLLAPDKFLPLAEESGLICDIDAWVRKTALRQARTWLDGGLRLRVALNVSTRGLRDPSLVPSLAALLAEFRLDPDQVEVEITDRVVMGDDDLLSVLAPLSALGVRIAIDDFGTGTSVLARLQLCPLDTLKIDRSFIQTIATSPTRTAVISALLAMAHGLGLDVVAEGVETTEQEMFLRDHGCPVIQGFLFSCPVPPEDVADLALGLEEAR